jgi:hypothetical protein
MKLYAKQPRATAAMWFSIFLPIASVKRVKRRTVPPATRRLTPRAKIIRSVGLKTKSV